MAETLTPMIWHFGRVGSCLDVAAKLARRGLLADFDSVLCVSQEHGRGQMRRIWQSPPGNVYATLRLPATPPFTTDFAAPAVGYLLAQALTDQHIPTHIKWPNDLVVERSTGAAKFGGILLEERAGIVLAGIGINLSFSPDAELLRRDHALPATSLACLGFSDLSPQKFWQALVMRTIKVYKETRTLADCWPQLLSPYLLGLGKQVVVEGRSSEETTQGLLQGLGPNGGFLLAQNGSVREIMGTHLTFC
ncbi:MAG: biotin--acetyl-CoA-carboxylase ligase [Desulfovibrio sp.]|nr:biotin--acetyl-CoA-carboxylase ligase [Desulfovibrio sp.]